MEESKEKKSLCLSDNPVCRIQEDKFQFLQIAEMLKRILEDGSLPMHIGLLGPWGSGKTSVIKMLEMVTSDNFHLKNVSVWKFADDSPSLHRKIVREIERVLNCEKREGIDWETTIQNTINFTGINSLWSILFEPRTEEDKKFKAITLIYLFLTVIFGGIAVATNHLMPTLLTIFMTLAFSNQALQRSFQTSTKNIALQHGDQYEARFEHAVDSFLSRNKGKKLILVFEDLDRLPPTQIIAALNTIKTFLLSTSCAFIIPCDENILRQGIITALQDKKNEGDQEKDTAKLITEFFNKTFDVTIRLPIVEQANMKRYARQLFKETNLEWANDERIPLDRVLGNLIYTGVNTPRHVKNLLNAFAFDWLLASKRDRKAGQDFLTRNPIAISIFTVLKTDFPEYYARLNNNPFTIKQEDTSKLVGELKNTNVPLLLAYLSRVSHSLPDDPRPFVYFSNHILNPIIGKPEVEKVVDYLVNAQSSEFKSNFSNLSDQEKHDVLSAFLDSSRLDSTIEIENSLRVLIDNPDALAYIEDSDTTRWDAIVRSNFSIINEYSLETACTTIDLLSCHNTTWHLFRDSLDLKSRYKELLKLWYKKPNYAKIMNLNAISNNLQDLFLENQEGYSLLNIIFELESDSELLKKFDWIAILNGSLGIATIPDFKISNWLEEYSKKSDFTITCKYLNKIFDEFDFKDDNALEGMGELWCKSYSINSVKADVLHLLEIIRTNIQFNCFTDEDYHTLGKFLKDMSVNEPLIQKSVEEILEAYWTSYPDYTCDLIENWSGCPGVGEFCAKTLTSEIKEEHRKRMLNAIIDAENRLQTDGGLPLRLATEIANSASTSTKSSIAISIIKSLNTIDHWKLLFDKYIEQWFPENNPHIWLTWSEIVVQDRINLFCSVCKDNITKQNWLLTSLSFLASADRGTNYGFAYNHMARRYLNLIITQVFQKIIFENWNEIIQIFNSNTYMDLLDVPVKEAILNIFAKKAQMNDDLFNQMLLTHCTVNSKQHQNSIVGRWEYLKTIDRTNYIEKIAQQENKVMQEFIDNFLKYLENNPLPEFIEELGTWNLSDSDKRDICKTIVKALSSDRLSDWINHSLNSMNIDGEERWTYYALELTIELRKDYKLPEFFVLETSLGLKDDRARLALKFLNASKLSKNEASTFKEKVKILQKEFPELSSEFKKRFSFRFTNFINRN